MLPSGPHHEFLELCAVSGTNQYDGTALDYPRNEVLDANNWFNGYTNTNNPRLPKAKERQNDFGGTLLRPTPQLAATSKAPSSQNSIDIRFGSPRFRRSGPSRSDDTALVSEPYRSVLEVSSFVTAVAHDCSDFLAEIRRPGIAQKRSCMSLRPSFPFPLAFDTRSNPANQEPMRSVKIHPDVAISGAIAMCCSRAEPSG